MNAKKTLKVSLITTEYNERASIDEFLDSALAQSQRPDEIVIADAGSTDGTIERIQERIKKGDPLALVVAKGNRSVGRNAAIRAAKNNIIAVADVGCRLDNDWLKEITKPFQNKGAEVVAGFFKADPQTEFERVSSVLMTDSQKEIDLKNWLPSSRSFAFTKRAWEKVGGYPEYKEFGDDYVARMCGGEDTLFDLKLRKAGYEFHDGLKAVVYWRPRKNLREFFRQYWMYSIGDGIRLVDFRHFIKLKFKYAILIIITVLLSLFWPILLMPFDVLILLKIAWRVLYKWKKVGGVKNLIWMMLMITTYDLAQITGFARGLLARLSVPKEKRITYEPQ